MRDRLADPKVEEDMTEEERQKVIDTLKSQIKTNIINFC